MKFFYIFHKTLLYLAIEKQNTEMINLLLSNPNYDPNIIFI